MSVRMIDAAFRVEGITGTTKLVLIALADNANDDGECWPGKKYLLAKTGIKDESTLRRHFRKLEDAGLLKVERQRREDGSQTANRYWLNLAPPLGSQPTPLGSKPSLEPSIEPTQEVNTCIEVWNHYLSAFSPRRKEPDEGQRKIIRDALKVASVSELKTCIDACAGSDFHQQRGGGKVAGRKHNRIGDILKPKRASQYGSGYTQRERIDFWLDRADKTGGQTQEDRDRIREEWVAARNRWAEGEGPDPGPRPNYEKGVSQ